MRQNFPVRLIAAPRILLAALAAGSLLAATVEVKALTATANLTVQVNITASCTVGASTLDFGAVAGTSLTSVAQATGSVSVTCTNGSPYAIGMGQGANYSTTNRMVNGGANYLSYGLYTDSGYSHPWTTAASNNSCSTANSCVTGTGTGAAVATPLYGQIAITSPAPAPGAYTDTVVMTVTY
jgi:spore coat protein U-like protein